MSGRVGYEYRYRFLKVHEDEINSKYKSNVERKRFLFQFRTNFILEARIDEVVVNPILDSETFNASVNSTDLFSIIYCVTYHRLEEYWMSPQEMKLLLEEALAFANEKAAEGEVNNNNLVPVVVRLDVCTVQQEGESLGAAMDRAIRAQNLLPLYLWPHPTERKVMSAMRLFFLKRIERIRVNDIDEGLALMPACDICKRKPNIGSQISSLPCNHVFHSLCIYRWLEAEDACPVCDVLAYPHRGFFIGPEVE